MAAGAVRPWYTATARQRGLPEIGVSVTGAELTPLAGALALVALAGFGAVLATRGRLRRVLGAIVAAVSFAVAVITVHPPAVRVLLEEELSARGWSGGSYDAAVVAWRWLVLAGAVSCVVGGAAVLRSGSGWSGRGSGVGPEYDAAADGRSPSQDLTEAEVWREIDSGRDPTQSR